jgi:hypothetical protein
MLPPSQSTNEPDTPFRRRQICTSRTRLRICQACMQCRTLPSQLKQEPRSQNQHHFHTQPYGGRQDARLEPTYIHKATHTHTAVKVRTPYPLHCRHEQVTTQAWQPSQSAHLQAWQTTPKHACFTSSQIPFNTVVREPQLSKPSPSPHKTPLRPKAGQHGPQAQCLITGTIGYAKWRLSEQHPFEQVR